MNSNEVLAQNVEQLMADLGVTSHATLKRHVEASGGRAISNGTLGRVRKKDTQITLGLLETLAENLGVETWQLLHPQGRKALDGLGSAALNLAHQFQECAVPFPAKLDLFAKLQSDVRNAERPYLRAAGIPRQELVESAKPLPRKDRQKHGG